MLVLNFVDQIIFNIVVVLLKDGETKDDLVSDNLSLLFKRLNWRNPVVLKIVIELR